MISITIFPSQMRSADGMNTDTRLQMIVDDLTVNLSPDSSQWDSGLTAFQRFIHQLLCDVQFEMDNQVYNGNRVALEWKVSAEHCPVKMSGCEYPFVVISYAPGDFKLEKK